MDTIQAIMIELKKKYKSGSALEILQEAILIGDLKGGTEITQNELAEALGTSRMPVREALIALEYQGLVERQSNQHVNITHLFDSSVYEVFQDMAALEIEIIKNEVEDFMRVLSVCKEQAEFHRLICNSSWSPLRKKLLKITTEVYLPFVLEHTNDIQSIDAVYKNLRKAVTPPTDMEIIRAAYDVYSKLLAKEFIRIKWRRAEECLISGR